jgi:hypothetical protein
MTKELTAMRTLIQEKEKSMTMKDAEIQSLKHRLSRVCIKLILE